MGQAVSNIFSDENAAGRMINQLAETLSSLGQQPPPQRYVPAEEDVLSVHQKLLEYLPNEIIHLILDQAEYWPSLISHRESRPPLCVKSVQTLSYDGSLCYLVTPRIPERWKQYERVIKPRRVVFHIVSNDQGWGGDPGLRGRFDGSWTWFEAAIIRGLTEDDERKNPDELKALLQEAAESEDDSSLPFLVPNPANDQNVWHLQSNVRASPHPEMHEVVWDLTPSLGAVPPLPVCESEVSPTTGSGHGLGFVAALQPGDSIAVFAKARFPGWTNHVTFVDVQIFYAL